MAAARICLLLLAILCGTVGSVPTQAPAGEGTLRLLAATHFELHQYAPHMDVSSQLGMHWHSSQHSGIMCISAVWSVCDCVALRCSETSAAAGATQTASASRQAVVLAATS